MHAHISRCERLAKKKENTYGLYANYALVHMLWKKVVTRFCLVRNFV